MSFTEGPATIDRRTARANGRQILSASWTMLRADMQLLWLPVFSLIGSVTAALIVFVPGFAAGRALGGTDRIGIYAGSALAAAAASVVAIFFQAALVLGAFQRADGVQPTVGGVLAGAWRLRGPIFGWAALTTTVGMVMRAVEERLGIFGNIIGFLGGVAWAIVSFLVVPVLVAEGLGPIAAAKRASGLVRDTWGTSLRTTLRFGVIQVFAVLGVVIAFALGVGAAVTGAPAGLVIGGLVAVAALVAFVALIIIFAAVSTYSRALIYRYAAGLPVAGIPEAALAGAFIPKKRSRR